MPAHKRLFSYKGEQLSLPELAQRTGIPESTIRTRIDSFGWSVEDAVETQPQKKFKPSRTPKGLARPCPQAKEHPTGQVYCQWSVKGVRYTRYFGKIGTNEANEAYKRFQLEWIEGTADIRTGDELLTVELAAKYSEWAEGHYTKKGKRTSESFIIKAAMRGLASVVSDEQTVNEFNADDLRLIQTHFVGQGLARETINGYIQRVVRAFRWGSSRTGADRRTLVNPLVVTSLEAVEPLVKGRTKAHDRPKVGSVAWADVEKVFPHLSPSEPLASVSCQLTSESE